MSRRVLVYGAAILLVIAGVVLSLIPSGQVEAGAGGDLQCTTCGHSCFTHCPVQIIIEHVEACLLQQCVGGTPTFCYYNCGVFLGGMPPIAGEDCFD